MSGRSTAAVLAAVVVLVLLRPSHSAREPAASAAEVVVEGALPASSLNTTQNLGEVPGSQIPLLDCAYASGSPHGLSCSKEGYFIVGFERRGQWIAGGGTVPLSRALCCRIGAPANVTTRDVPDVPLTPSKPVAVVSFGCHSSTAEGGEQVKCEDRGNAASFLTGYSSAVGVGLQLDTFYPLGFAQCCTPALLLEDGSLWSYERCNCRVLPSTVNCPKDQGMLSTGFSGWRITRSGNYVPVAPQTCCQVCLGEQIQPTDDCSELNDCSGRGRCSYGRCECYQGWAGTDCSHTEGDKAGGVLDSWQLAVVIIGATGMLASLLILCSHLYRLQQRDEMEGGNDDYMEPLLLDENGSVGSVDTSDDEGGDEELPCSNATGTATRTLPPAPAEAHIPDAAPQAILAAEANESTELEPGTVAASGGENGENEEILDIVQDNNADPDTPQPTERELLISSHAPESAESGECLCCMSKPIQAVLIPCGHAVACRRCARRLERCPMCRKDILRRQRLYLGK